MSTADLRAVATGKPAEGKNPVAAFSTFLDKFKPQLALALPKHMTADRMARLVLTAFSTTPKLQACEPRSIMASVMVASQLGLEIGVNGQGYLIPYKTTCTFVPGWKGLVDLVSRSGRGTVWTGAVFEGDAFDYGLGDRPFVMHKPGIEDDPNKLTHVYAIGRVNGSDYPVIEVWPIEKVRRHRDKYNKVGSQHYSFRDWEMYARKVPLLQVIKYMPTSIELANAVEAANAAERGATVTIDGNFVTVAEPSEPPTPIAGEEIEPPDHVVDANKKIDPPAAETLPQPPTATFAEVNDAMQKATTLDQLDDAAGLIPAVASRAHQKELNAVFSVRRAALGGEA